MAVESPSTSVSERLSAAVRRHFESSPVPGCAIAAVKDGQVVYHEAFGLRDVANGLPATTETLFAIGSTFKAMTAAAVGVLVDDGLVDLETPIRDYIPEFQLADSVATARVTPLDLLCHRSGVPSHDFLWIGFPERTRADLLARLRHLPTRRDYRSMFQYFNLGYMTLGRLVDVVSGIPFEDFVTARLLQPLGMSRSNFRVADLLAADDHSNAHETRGGVMTKIPPRVVDSMSPAGGLNSCSSDMVGWLLGNLVPIGVEGVISSENRRRMQTPQMVLTGATMGEFSGVRSFVYGLGWMLGTYRGRRLVHHGGGIDGFSSQVLLLPDDGIGVVLLMNAGGGSLGAAAYRVLDELLGLEPPPEAQTVAGASAPATGGTGAVPASPLTSVPARPLQAYAGDYVHPAYGTFRVGFVDGKLTPKFGTMLLDLVHSEADVFDLQWRELTDSITTFQLGFHASPEGDIVALTVPFEAAVDPIRFERAVDPRGRDPHVLAALAGTYSMGDVGLSVALKDDATLTASVAGAPPIELEQDRGLRFIPRQHPLRQGQGSVPPGPRSFEFVLGPGGAVEQVLVRPLGIFQPEPRVQPG